MSIVVSKTRLPVTEWQTESGSVVSIANARRRDAKSAVVTLEPIQDLHGYSAPWVGGAGKNLCQLAKHPENPRAFWGTDFPALVTILNNLPVGTYTISCKFRVVSVPSNGKVMHGRPYITALIDGSQRSVTNYSVATDSSATQGKIYNESGTFSITAEKIGNINHCYMYCDRESPHSGDDRGSYDLYDIQIESGSTATAYETYENLCPISGHSAVTLNHAGTSQSDNPTSITVQLGQTVYGGSVDLVSGVGTVTKALQTWTKCGGAGSSAGCFYVFASVPITKSVGRAIATYLKTYDGVGQSSNMPNWSLTQSGGGQYTIWGKFDSSYTSKTDFDNYLASNPLSICYELATPITFQLTPNQIQMLERNNTLWAEEGDIEVQYARIHQ